MNIVTALINGFKNYAVFEGRATRTEFWTLFILFNLVSLVIENAESLQEGRVVFGLALAVGIGTNVPWIDNIMAAIFVLPLLSVTARRFQDAGVRPSLLVSVPIGALILAGIWTKIFPAGPVGFFGAIGVLALVGLGFFYVTLKRSQPGSNRYGPNPTEVPQ